MTVRFAVLGAGRIGQVHGDAIASVADASFVAVADPVAAAADLVRRKHGCDVRTIEEIASASDVDAVVICTPTDTHADLIETFARAGKAVFCEKPIDLDIGRVKACLKVVDDTGVTLMVGFQRRFDPDFQALKAVIDQGRIGTVEMVTLTSRDPAPPPLSYIERSGGIFRDMTIHDFDVARWMLGEEVSQVMASGSVLVDPAIGEIGDFDSVNVILTTASGRQATVTNTRRATYGYDQRIEVHGSDGAVSAENHHEAGITVATAEGYSQPPLLNFFMSRYTAAYAAEIAAFVEAVKTDTPPPTTGNDGLMALALAEAALQSTRSGRAVRVDDIL
jgi:myo-inositol 2-dehydrogenase/D-chiro-inositol 1-dehydrogenase